VKINPRPLAQVLDDIEAGHPLTKALAEEAVASVAADGLASRAEAERLSRYADGTMSADKWAAMRPMLEKLHD
jgi:hypothetical protein